MSFEIGRVIETQEPFSLDIKSVIASRTYIASETRMGKSWTARKIVEEVYGHIPIIILDPEGEYSSLREKYSFVIIGRDVPLEVETAEFMAEWILKENVSVIIDTSMVKDDKDYIDRFLNHFFYLETTSRKPYLLIVEEAEDYASEKGAPGVFLGITAVLARKGGKRGIGVIYVGHRPAWISKGILSQCPNKAIGKIESTDFKALEDFARIPHEIVEKLPSLGKGEFCLSGDWVNQPTFIKVGTVKTTHMGASPDIVPPSPKELESTIESLRKKLPEIIEKAKTAVTPISEIRSKIESELKNKYESKIESIRKNADEKAERKYKVRIDELQLQAEKLSRSQALQPTAPITDALEHPIVKTRMLQLDDKARDLLIWVEREPGHTREELAARMVSSKDVIGNMVDKINRVFQLQVIVDDGGRPLRYKSMLKRLFLTDVAKREIEELRRLQTDNQAKTQKIKSLEDENATLRSAAQHNTIQRGEVEKLCQEVTTLKKTNTSLDAALDTAKGDIEQLKKEVEIVQKLRELLSVGTSGVDIEKRLATFRSDLTTELQQLLDHLVQEGEKTLPQIEALIDKKIKELAPTAPNIIPTSVDLTHKVTHFDFQKPEEHLKADTTTLEGRLIFLITKGFFNDRHNRKQIVTELSNNGWIHGNKEVDAALLELCGKGIFYRKISTGRLYWFTLQEDAKNLIHT